MQALETFGGFFYGRIASMLTTKLIIWLPPKESSWTKLIFRLPELL